MSSSGPIDPEEVIARLSVEELCASAEAYYASASDSTYLIAKPFASPVEAPDYLWNMGLLLSGMHLGKTMTVLDFAAGTGWFSRYLSQLGCRTISCDVSTTALELGRRLFQEHPIIGEPVAPPVFLPFNGHRIDLPSESVDRIVCFDAFHHVPNQSEVLAELARVLISGGIAGFCEPGPHHSEFPESQAEMARFDVLENNIVLDEVVALAYEAGFTDFRCRLRPDLELSLQEYQALAKRELPLQLGARVVRNLRHSFDHGCIFFLHRGPVALDSRGHLGLAHTLQTDSQQLHARAGENVRLRVEASNTGHAKWLASNFKGIGEVLLGAHLYTQEGGTVDFDLARSRLERDVFPGERLPWTIELCFPAAGCYRLDLDLVSEFVTWFEARGSTPLAIDVIVE